MGNRWVQTLIIKIIENYGGWTRCVNLSNFNKKITFSILFYIGYGNLDITEPYYWLISTSTREYKLNLTLLNLARKTAMYIKLFQRRKKYINLSPRKFLIIPINRVIFLGDNIICISLTHERISFTKNFTFSLEKLIKMC